MDYRYKAEIVSVFDADMLRIDIDVGFGIWLRNEPIRLLGINAPEFKGETREAGIISRDALREKLPKGTEIEIQTIKDKKGKYGRYLATIFLDGLNINNWLVKNNYAIYKDY